MTIAIVGSGALDGMAAAAVSVEVHLADGLPSFTWLGDSHSMEAWGVL